jgi:hypothetical protein
MNITDQFDGEKLSTMINGVKHYTPLFVVLVLIGTTDVIFAVDSIPAIFAITSDPFIVLTANIFAILGLRALYFLLADLANRFHLLAYGLALVLVFIGSKMLLIDVYKIPIGYALLVTAADCGLHHPVAAHDQRGRSVVAAGTDRALRQRWGGPQEECSASRRQCRPPLQRQQRSSSSISPSRVCRAVARWGSRV